MLIFHNSKDIKKLYEIQYINRMTQQRYEYTQKFSQRTPICVKCAENYPNSSCSRNRNDPPKCVNCAEIDPGESNYRGCVIAKELQKRLDNIETQKQQLQPKEFTANKVRNELSYAQITKHTQNYL